MARVRSEVKGHSLRNDLSGQLAINNMDVLRSLAEMRFITRVCNKATFNLLSYVNSFMYVCVGACLSLSLSLSLCACVRACVRA